MSDATRLADRALLRVSGDDVRGFLQGLVTQDLAQVGPGRSRWSGLLTPQGKALFDFVLWDGADRNDPDTILIDCEDKQRDALIRRLTIYRLRRPIEIAAVDGGVHWSPDGTRGPADPRLPELGSRWLGGDGEDAGAAWLAHRLRLGVVEGAAELGQDATLWLECNAGELAGVSFSKGCYVGQENTARMHYRNKVGRRLVVAPVAPAGPRTRATYQELGLMVEHRRVDALGDAIAPRWLTDALENPEAAGDTGAPL